MGKTVLTIDKTSFRINGTLTYSDNPSSPARVHGLLMNARFIQGVFDDKVDRKRYDRWGMGPWDPGANTDRLIDALPEWYRYGLRAITVSFQGGAPWNTIPNNLIDNNPFGENGDTLDPAYAQRMDRLIRAADALGMVVIVSYLYQGQAPRLRDGRAIRNAVVTASRFLREGGYTNVIAEVANEHEVGCFRDRPIVCSEEGISMLIDLARRETGGMPVGSSAGGGQLFRQVAEASDIVLVHGNGCSRQQYYKLIERARSWAPDKPIVCNEDSHAIGQLAVAFDTESSWGYYNTMTKQEPPADWSVTAGEDQFFAYRMAMGLGIDVPETLFENQFRLQGAEPHTAFDGKRWLRMACMYPEMVDRVEFFRNGTKLHTCWDEPFMLNWECNFAQKCVLTRPDDREWKAVAYLRDGRVVEKAVTVA